MNFGLIQMGGTCVNVAPPRDSRCDDPAFSLANPDVCPAAPLLIIKPATALVCQLRSIQFKATYVENGVESDVTDQVVFNTSNPAVAVVGAASGNATGLSAGDTSISASFRGIDAFADLTVLGDSCCAAVKVAMMVVIDRTKSMSLRFSSNYLTKLHYAREAATQFINGVNSQKDVVGLIQFTDDATTVLASPTSDTAAVEALVPGIGQSQQKTTYFTALQTAIAELDAVTATKKMIVLISEGEDTDSSYADETNPIQLCDDFKTAGGIILCLGVRAHSRGYATLSAFATGGFFINAHEATEDISLTYLKGLKGYVCAGNCTPTGDEFVASGSLNFCEFTNWIVEGRVDLIGSGFLDLLPGNGLYVDLAGSTAPHMGKLILKDPLAVEAGKTYGLALELAGNQRVDDVPNTVRIQIFERNNDGIPDQDLSSAPALSNGAGSAPVETYEYAFSYVGTYGETTLTPPVSIANGGFETFDIEVTNDSVLGAEGPVIAIRFWKRTVGTEKWYLIAEGAPDSTSFTDTYNEARLEAAITAGTVDVCAIPVTTNTTGSPIPLLDQVVSINNFQQGFGLVNYSFTPDHDTSVFISIQQTATPVGGDAAGLLLASVTFTDVTDSVVLFTDDFDAENVQYVPPACGIGTHYVLLNRPLDVPENIIPAMTSNDQPSGLVSSGNTTNQAEADWYLVFDGTHVTGWFGAVSGGVLDANQWIQYKFDTAQVITNYKLASLFASSQGAPSDWIFQGSNNGLSWTTIDTRAAVTNWVSDEGQSFAVGSPGSYLYYRITFTGVMDADEPAVSFSVRWMEMLIGGGGDPIYGYVTGVSCYGDPCLDEPPAVQSEDPAPLADIELGYIPPQTYTSTKTACVTCPAGFENAVETPLIPQMTSNTAPSGVAFGSSTGSGSAGTPYFAFDRNNVTGWFAADITSPTGIVGYQFATATAVAAYSIMPFLAPSPVGPPRNWTFEASNDGVTWTTLDTRTNIVTWGSEPNRFAITNTTAYLYYRLNVTLTNGGGPGVNLTIAELQFYAAAVTQVCKTATAESTVSQGAADAAALASASALALVELNCIGAYNSTHSYTANCPAGSFGPAVTRSATRVSFISQADADAQALAAAQEAAEAARDCSGSNNDQPIQFQNGTLASALPYASVKFVEGLTGVVTAVTITLKQIRHFDFRVMLLVLRAPDGTSVMILGLNGGVQPFTTVPTDITFDQAAGGVMPHGQPIAAGSYRPTVEGTKQTTQLPLPAPLQPYGVSLADFNGINPNGSWSLWAVHQQFYTIFNPDNAKILAGWDISIST